MDQVKVQQFIFCSKRREGDGKLTPIRIITEIYDFDGKLIASNDPCSYSIEVVHNYINEYLNIKFVHTDIEKWLRYDQIGSLRMEPSLPVTRDILEKSGFYHDAALGCYKLNNIVIYSWKELNQSDSGYYYVNGMIKTTIHSLKQLRNLYFGLIGKELIVNL